MVIKQKTKKISKKLNLNLVSGLLRSFLPARMPVIGRHFQNQKERIHAAACVYPHMQKKLVSD